MSFFDNIEGKLTGLSQDAIKKTKDVSGTVKLSALVKEEEMKQRNLFLQLGKACYLIEVKNEDFPTQEVVDLMQGIKNCDAQIMNYKDQIAKLKGMELCPNCNAEVATTAAFCSSCGTKIERVQKAPAGNVCKTCGNTVESGYKFCVNCGTPVEEAPAPAAQEYAEAEAPAPAAQEYVEVETPGVCSECGADVIEGNLFCVNCGKKYE